MIHHGDCLDVMRGMGDNSVDSIVTDPPYGWRFMGKAWDCDIPRTEVWSEALRVLKPGGHLLSFGGCRTYHRMVVAIEDAGFEIRDQIQWIYGSGFPKASALSHSKSGVFCRCASYTNSNENTAPSQQTINRKSTQAISGDGALPLSDAPHSNRKPSDSPAYYPPGYDSYGEPAHSVASGAPASFPPQQCAQERICSDVLGDGLASESGGSLSQVQYTNRHANTDYSLQQNIVEGGPLGIQENKSASANMPTPTDSEASAFHKSHTALKSLAWPKQCTTCGKPNANGWFNGGLKPANEPIVLARKPLSEKTVAANVLKWSTGALNIDSSRIGSAGRFPSNLLLDETAAEMLDGQSGVSKSPLGVVTGTKSIGGIMNSGRGRRESNTGHGDKGGASRFFFIAKSDKENVCQNQRDSDLVKLAASSFKGPTRFLYQAKASKRERNEGLEGCTSDKVNDGRQTPIDNPFQRGETLRLNTHPTVKPITLMRYLCRLVTPPNGIVLDPFAGSGSTGVAAIKEGFKFIGIEREAQYIEIANQRIANLKNSK